MIWVVVSNSLFPFLTSIFFKGVGSTTKQIFFGTLGVYIHVPRCHSYYIAFASSESTLGRRHSTHTWVVATQIFFMFIPFLGKWSNLTDIFQMGWNHQLDTLVPGKAFLVSSDFVGFNQILWLVHLPRPTLHPSEMGHQWLIIPNKALFLGGGYGGPAMKILPLMILLDRHQYRDQQEASKNMCFGIPECLRVSMSWEGGGNDPPNWLRLRMLSSSWSSSSSSSPPWASVTIVQ